MPASRPALKETAYSKVPLHRLSLEDAATQKVSALSVWGDSVWRFPVKTAGHGSHVTVNWDFEMPGGSLMDPIWAHLLDFGRRLFWSIWHNNQRGKRPKPLALPSLMRFHPLSSAVDGLERLCQFLRTRPICRC